MAENLSRQRFFVLPRQIREDKAIITGADAKHIINVLRMKAGDQLVLSDGVNFEYEAAITGTDVSRVAVEILGRRKIDLPFPQVALVQAIPRGHKMDIIIRQATELGITSVIPVITSRTVARPDEKRRAKKLARWGRIAKEAAGQSQRSTVPDVLNVHSWSALMQSISFFDLTIAFWEHATEYFSESVFKAFGKTGPAKCAVLIGPEGGFSPEEIEDLRDHQVLCLSLGKQVLRTETASAVALGIFFYELVKLGDNRV